jgi:hypothetical protein
MHAQSTAYSLDVKPYAVRAWYGVLARHVATEQNCKVPGRAVSRIDAGQTIGSIRAVSRLTERPFSVPGQPPPLRQLRPGWHVWAVEMDEEAARKAALVCDGVVKRSAELLEAGGQIIASIPNVTHGTVLLSLLR